MTTLNHAVTQFRQQLAAGTVDFEDTIALIERYYDYTPTRFKNGLTDPVINEAGQNAGSCRIFAFAQLNHFSPAEALACFGRFYQEVVNDPQGSGHGNIRRFMVDGWAGIQFDGMALTAKNPELALNSEGRAELLVQFSDTAKALATTPEDDFPAVLATARMVAMMELAAARCLKPLLQDGQLSVGVDVHIRHLAATPVGVAVTAVARYLGQEGKLYRFSIEAFDQGGKIGEGHHTRAIISTERLVAGATQRNQKAD